MRLVFIDGLSPGGQRARGAIERAIADLQPLNPLDPPAVRRLNEIRVPTLIVAGALDHAENLRAADVLTTDIRGAKKISIPDAAHVPNMEQPALFNRAVLDFLAE